MKRIGLTGMSGSGKSYIASLFSHYGIPVINTDRLVHDLYSYQNPCTEALAARFGNDIVSPDHTINRRRLASIVFCDPNNLSDLNALVHPYVVKACNDLLDKYEASGYRATLIEAPQLFEAGLHHACDAVIAVMADSDICFSRIMERDHLSEQEAQARLSHQHDSDFFRRFSDYCLINDGKHNLDEQIQTILKEMGLL